GVTGYLVERQNPGSANFVQVGTATNTAFSDTGLAPLNTYSYRVRATDVAGNLSPYSNIASATTPAQSVLSWTNAGVINIPSVGNATPYPSTINVSGMSGTISDVTVTLRNVSHTWPADIDILLVGPGGQKAVIFSDVGGGNDINNITVTLSDSAGASLTATGLIVAGTYKPTDVEPGENGDLDNFSAPAPAGPY